MSRSLDIIVFGASGYTGKWVVEILVEILEKEGKTLKWGIAGRSNGKLEEVLEKIDQKTGGNLSGKVPIIIADTTDLASLEEMAKQAKLIINCTGPHKFHGEPVIQACIKETTHYLDMNAEPLFIQRVQSYQEQAKEKGIYIVTGCGGDGVPADLGVEYIRQKFNGTLNSVELFLEAKPGVNPLTSGPIGNYGTWASLVYALSDMLNYLNKQKNELPTLKPKLEQKYLYRNNLFTGWALSIPGSLSFPHDPIIYHSQKYFSENTNQRPLQVKSYLVFPTCWQFFTIILALIWGFLAQFKFGVKLLLDHPKLFSCGIFGNDPSPKTTSKFRFSFLLRGYGWKKKNAGTEYSAETDDTIIAKISGKDVYRFTAITMVIPALVLLEEPENLPKNGGVFTPAAVFSNTTICQLLHKYDLIFEILNEGNKNVHQ